MSSSLYYERFKMTTQLHPNMVQGMNNFNSAKPANDIDLIAKVREILAGFTPEEQLVAHYDNHRLIKEAQGKISDVQKFFLNRYWYVQFCTAPDSSSARGGLIPDGDVGSWLKIFQMVCIPFVQRHSLPVQIEAAAQ